MPTILSNNTGHSDLINLVSSKESHESDIGCFPLSSFPLNLNQSRAKQKDRSNAFTQNKECKNDKAAEIDSSILSIWKESDPYEIVEIILSIQRDYSTAEKIGNLGAKLLRKNCQWKENIEDVLKYIY